MLKVYSWNILIIFADVFLESAKMINSIHYSILKNKFVENVADFSGVLEIHRLQKCAWFSCTNSGKNIQQKFRKFRLTELSIPEIFSRNSANFGWRPMKICRTLHQKVHESSSESHQKFISSSRWISIEAIPCYCHLSRWRSPAVCSSPGGRRSRQPHFSLRTLPIRAWPAWNGRGRFEWIPRSGICRTGSARTWWSLYRLP